MRSEYGATVLPLQVGRFARPCARSTYTYTPSVRSPAQLASTCFGPLGAAPCGHFASLVRSPASRSARLPSERLRLSSAHSGPDSDRAWHLGYWEARLATCAVSPEPLLRGHPRHVFAACAVAHARYRRSAKTRRSREVTLVRYRTLRSTSTESALAIG